MRTIAVVGHAPGALGGLWRPVAWMPVVELLRARLAALAADGPIRVVTTLEPGIALMAAAAALIARDEGLPVTLHVVLAHPLPSEPQEPRAVWRWAQRAYERADSRSVLFPRAPRTRPEAAAAFEMALDAQLTGCERVLACWNGRRGNRTWQAVQRAEAAGLLIDELWPEVAAALHLPDPAAEPAARRHDDSGVA